MMAEGIQYVCGHCGKTIEAWSDGNPYYRDKLGKKHYAYHPNHELLARCIGNDLPHLCLDCGKSFMVDSADPVTKCPKCNSAGIAHTWRLEGRDCPFCGLGAFTRNPNWSAVS